MISRSLPSDRQTPIDYMALGDSTVYGLGASSPSRHYVARLSRLVQSEYPVTRVTNLGSCLATAADVLTDQLPHVLTAQPHLVTLSFGPNDLRQRCPPEDFAGRAEVILERLERDTDAAVVVNALPDLASSPRFRASQRARLAELTHQFNHALQRVADGFGIKLVDLGPGDGVERLPRRYFCEDGYHPSDDGYAAWASAMWQAVWELIPEPALVAVRA
jgi:acyl-CoA thioesterase I